MSEQEQPHWITQEGPRKRFWAECAKLHATRQVDVHAALSVAAAMPIEHVEEFPGTVEEALLSVAAYMQEAVQAYTNRDPINELQYAAEHANPGDALGRLSWKVAGPSGASYLLTASIAGLSPQAIRQMHREIHAHLDVIEAGYPGHGYTLLADGRDQPAAGNPATRHAAQVRAAGGDEAVQAALAKAQARLSAASEPEPEPWDAAQGVEEAASKPAARPTPLPLAGEISFPLETVTVAVTPTGKRYYQVKGGKFKKYGGKAWPEVFEALFDVAGWEPGTDHPVEPGLTCYCEPNDKGYPGRCVRIA